MAIKRITLSVSLVLCGCATPFGTRIETEEGAWIIEHKWALIFMWNEIKFCRANKDPRVIEAECVTPKGAGMTNGPPEIGVFKNPRVSPGLNP